jgi:hypothetical protein
MAVAEEVFNRRSEAIYDLRFMISRTAKLPLEIGLPKS